MLYYTIDFRKEHISFCFKLIFSAPKLSNQERIRHIRTLQKPSICYHLRRTLISPFEIQYFTPQSIKSKYMHVHLYMRVWIGIWRYIHIWMFSELSTLSYFIKISNKIHLLLWEKMRTSTFLKHDLKHNLLMLPLHWSVNKSNSYMCIHTSHQISVNLPRKYRRENWKHFI